MHKATLILLATLPFAAALTGCDQVQQKFLGEDPAAKAARLEAEGKAVGGACRHSGRAIEDCYAIYHWLPKAAVFAGWQEMDTYMRTNKIDTVEPQLPPPQPPGTKRKTPLAETAVESGERAAAKGERSATKSGGTSEAHGESAAEKPDKAADKTEKPEKDSKAATK